MKVVVVIPAAGLGTRMVPSASGRKRGSAPSKQFAELNGTPILIQTLRKFAVRPDISEIYVVLRESEMNGFRDRLAKDLQDVLAKKVRIVEGGEHRQESVANAVRVLGSSGDDIVLIHDAVRPFITDDIIQDVIAAARKHGAAIAAFPAVDTVKQVERTPEGAVITATIPRERVVMAQTPQGFRFDVLKKAFEEAASDGFVGTDESSLVERSGHRVAVVMGSPKNMKITTPADMELAEFYSRR